MPRTWSSPRPATLPRRWPAAGWLAREGRSRGLPGGHPGRTAAGRGEGNPPGAGPPKGGFRSDPYAPLVQALEHFDPVSQTAVKAAIFTGRVVAPRNPRLGADTPADALAICLDVCGEVQLEGIARLLGISEEQARRELGTLVFDDPGAGRLVPAAEYLSGRVRDK